jgi:hypothetical protein
MYDFSPPAMEYFKQSLREHWLWYLLLAVGFGFALSLFGD